MIADTPTYSEREIKEGIDYWRLRLGNFVPWRGGKEYANRTENNRVNDPKNSDKISRREHLLLSYNTVFITASGSALSSVIETGMKSLETFLK